MLFHIAFGLGSLLLGIVACQDSDKDSQKNDRAVRKGEPVIAEDLKYFEGDAQLTQDGQKVVFLSGRSEKKRAYVYDVSSQNTQEWFQADSLSEVSELALDPTGVWLLVIAKKSGQSDIFARKLDGTGSLVQVTDDEEIEIHLGVHPQGLAYHFSRQSDQRIFRVGTIDATNGPSASTSDVEGSNASITDLVWLDQAAPLALITKEVSDENFSTQLMQRSFATGSLGEAQSYSDLESFFLSPGSKIQASGAGVFAVAQNASASSERIASVKAIKEINGSPNTSVEVLDRLASVTSAETEYVSAGGTHTAAFSVANSGVFALIEIVPVYCSKDTIKYWPALRVGQSDSSTSRAMSYNKSKSLVSSSDAYCKTPSGSAGIDDRLASVVINRNATTSSYTLVLSSLISGDRELYLLRYDNGSETLSSIAANKKPQS